MAVDSRGANGRPIFLGTGAPATADDLTTLGQETYLRGTRLVGSTAERNSYPHLVEGLSWWDTDEDREYVRIGGAWRTLRSGTITANVAATGGLNGFFGGTATLTIPVVLASDERIVVTAISRGANWGWASMHTVASVSGATEVGMRVVASASATLTVEFLWQVVRLSP